MFMPLLHVRKARTVRWGLKYAERPARRRLTAKLRDGCAVQKKFIFKSDMNTVARKITYLI